MAKVHHIGEIQSNAFLSAAAVFMFVLTSFFNLLFFISLILGLTEETPWLFILCVVGIIAMTTDLILYKKSFPSRGVTDSRFFLIMAIVSAVGIVVYLILGEGLNLFYRGSVLANILSAVLTIPIIIIFIGFLFLTIAALFVCHKNSTKKATDDIAYKKQCFDEVDRIYTYYEHGSITKEEFEQFKKEILDSIPTGNVDCNETNEEFNYQNDTVVKPSSENLRTGDFKDKKEKHKRVMPNRKLGTKWMLFYIYIRFPIGLVTGLGSLITSYGVGEVFNADQSLVTASFLLDIMLYVLMIVTFICMIRKKQTGYLLNQVMLIVNPLIMIIVSLFLGTIVYNIPVIIGKAIFSILNLIYFNKRKHLFGSERIKPTEL